MKRFLFLLTLFSACKKEVKYYPSENFFYKKKPKEIIIDDLSFQEITDSIRNGLFRRERYFLTLNDSEIIYKISPFTYTGGFIKEKNALEIVNDSIYVSINKLPMSQLGKYLKLHYENNGKEYYLSDSYKRAFIKLVLKHDDNSKKINKLLLRIIKVYDETTFLNKDSVDLGIMLDYQLDRVLKTPPPPLEIED